MDASSTDFVARILRIEKGLEEFVRVHAKVPDDINVASAIILGRMATHDGPLRPGDLRRFGYFTGTNVSYLINEMAKRGYVHSSHDPYDQRCKTLKLTSTGRKVGIRVALSLQYVDNQIGKLLPHDRCMQVQSFLDPTNGVSTVELSDDRKRA